MMRMTTVTVHTSVELTNELPSYTHTVHQALVRHNDTVDEHDE